MLSQPIPDVSWNDVERLVRRDFPANKIGDVLSVLKEYAKDKWECARVQVAVLKLAHGNIERLRMHMMAAATDYRDVLAAAEYPEYFKKGHRVGALPAQEESQVIQSDWKQYKDWLDRK